jgi:hypothetical protein
LKISLSRKTAHSVALWVTFRTLILVAQFAKLGAIKFFQDNVTPPVLSEVFGAFVWGYLLGKINGYRRWWLLSAAGIVGVRVGDYALHNGLLERWVQDHTPPGFPVYLSFSLILGISVLCMTVSIGLLLGLILLNWKASVVLAVSTGTASVSQMAKSANCYWGKLNRGKCQLFAV